MNSDNFYLFISSSDSLSFHPDNKGSNFTVELPESVNLHGEWEAALCDFYHNPEVNEILYVFCDLCDYSYIGNSLEPIIRKIYPNSTSTDFQFSSNYYINVKNKNINRIKVYIRDVNFGFPSSVTGDIHLTLHLRRKDGYV